MAFDTTSQLAQHAERELGHNLSGASTQRADIVSHLDRAHKIVHAGGGILNYAEDGRRLRNEVVFPFARALNPKIITLLPAVSANVTATRNSNAISFSSDPNAGVSVANSFIRINSEAELYRIASHTAASTSAVLDGVYVGSANVVAASSSVFPLQYALGSSDILQLVSPIRAFDQQKKEIKIVDKDEMLEQYPLSNVSVDFPRLCAIVKESAGTITLQMNSYPADLKRIEIDHIPVPTTLDTVSSDPTIPAQFRLVLSHLTIHFMSLRNDDARAAQHLALARDMFAELVEWSEKLSSTGDPDFGRVRSMIPFGVRDGKYSVTGGWTRS